MGPTRFGPMVLANPADGCPSNVRGTQRSQFDRLLSFPWETAFIREATAKIANSAEADPAWQDHPAEERKTHHSQLSLPGALELKGPKLNAMDLRRMGYTGQMRSGCYKKEYFKGRKA